MPWHRRDGTCPLLPRVEVGPSTASTQRAKLNKLRARSSDCYGGRGLFGGSGLSPPSLSAVTDGAEENPSEHQQHYPCQG